MMLERSGELYNGMDYSIIHVLRTFKRLFVGNIRIMVPYNWHEI
jgi:hypothetical protein